MSEPRVLPTREGYDRWAATYDTMDNWLLALEAPEVDRALGEVRGLEILDVGTGTGRHAIRLSERGARVVGIDFSDKMLAKARDKAGAAAVRFLKADVTGRLPFSDGSFDRVLSALVLEHVADLRPFFSELGRVVRSDGRIVVTAMHPAMFVKGISANFHEEEGEVRPRSYETTLSDYVMGAIDAGLEISALAERSVDDALAARYERSRKLLGWPALVVMQCRRACR
jgi:malonyl-CoA O-methyltransferase